MSNVNEAHSWEAGEKVTQVLEKLLELEKRGDQLIKIHLDPITAFQIVAQMQLALRHPENRDATAETAKRFLILLQNELAKHVPEVTEVIAMGWHPEFDLGKGDKYKIQLIAGSPFQPLASLFPRGIPVLAPYPLGISGDQKLWGVNLKELTEEQLNAIATTIALRQGVPVEEVLEGAKEQGLYIADKWVSTCEM